MLRTARSNPSILSPLLVVAFVVAMALPAASAHADQLAATVSGVVSDGSAFDGAFRVNRFRSTRLGMVASGLLVGTVTGSQGEITDVLSLRVSVPVADVFAFAAGSGNGGNCDVLQFAMDPVDVALVSSTLQLDSFDMTLRRSTVGAVGSEFCAIADGFNNGRFTQIASSLNTILDALAKK